MFQYYKREELRQANGYWYIADRRLNLCASIDFAFSRSKKADYTCLVVVGIDGDRNVYVLDIERFKTDKISDYFAAILRLHQRWGFQKLLAEVTTAQDVIVKDLKNNYIYKYNLALSVVDHNPTRHQGSKEERTDSILQHRYNDRKIWHYRGGHCQLLEEELILKFPSHDDIKDALAVAVDAVVVPTMHGLGAPKNDRFANFSLKNVVHPRFGGIN
jgi:phage terminase large subunit-like protein